MGWEVGAGLEDTAGRDEAGRGGIVRGRPGGPGGAGKNCAGLSRQAGVGGGVGGTGTEGRGRGCLLRSLTWAAGATNRTFRGLERLLPAPRRRTASLLFRCRDADVTAMLEGAGDAQWVRRGFFQPVRRSIARSSTILVLRGRALSWRPASALRGGGGAGGRGAMTLRALHLRAALLTCAALCAATARAVDTSQCIAPLGMESGAIPDADISASSSFDSGNVIQGNTNTYLESKRELDPPMWASKVRFLPYSYHRRTVCMRVELYGCYWSDGIVSYSMPQGDKRGAGWEFFDAAYDGHWDGELRRGLGQLTDGKVGRENFKMGYYDSDRGQGWVGWRNDSRGGQPVEIKFEFDRVREFTAVHLYCNNQFTRDVQVFSEANILFSVGGKFFSGEPITYTYIEDRIFESSRNISIKLHHRVGRFVKLQLHFAAKWIMLSETLRMATSAQKWHLHKSLLCKVMCMWNAKALLDQPVRYLYPLPRKRTIHTWLLSLGF
ncbi:Discoidin domain-containing receptor 2 [Gryllus bimaculatus]|nr:Discoidin domain-containing receptor 2 [Gryllus bimaculatus]